MSFENTLRNLPMSPKELFDQRQRKIVKLTIEITSMSFV